jgi:hypothetical protein
MGWPPVSAPLLDRAAVEDIFRRLGDRLVRRGVVVDLYVFGRAAMALTYDARRATRDIDAVFQPNGVVRWWPVRCDERLNHFLNGRSDCRPLPHVPGDIVSCKSRRWTATLVTNSMFGS